MSQRSIEFAIWAALIMGAAAALILYQHAVHTGIVLSAIQGPTIGATPAASPSSGDGPIAAESPASGVWTPTGPGIGASVFTYNPPQNVVVG